MNKSFGGGIMKRYLKITGIVAAILFVIVGLWSVDNFYYPFKSVSPNYADVERAFARLQFPADWKEISSSENKGLFGRDCDPFNDSGCFHKNRTFSVPTTTTLEDAKKFMLDSGCAGVSVNDFTNDNDPKKSSNLYCAQGNVQLSATLKGMESTISVTTRTY